MHEILERVYDEARSAWRFRWIGLAVAAAVAVLGWLFVFSLPDRYEAKASVFVDTRTALRPVLQGLTMEQDVNVQLNYVRQSILSGERLERIARESGVLPADEVDPRQIAAILADFAQRIGLDVRNASGREYDNESGGSIYSFWYQDGDRERSLKVVQIVLNTFVEETLGGKRAGSENAQRFLEDQIKDYEERLRAAENRLAEFKKANVGLMPTEQGGAVTQLQAALDAAATLENDLNVALARRSELSRQLRGDAVIGATAVPSVGAAGAADTLSRINEEQARLDELLTRFTDKHPDVVAARRTLGDLQARRAQEIERLRSGDPAAAASSGVSSNPVYQSIQQQANLVDVEIASLRGRISQQRAKAADLRKRLDVAPQVEAEYAQLNRDYDVTKAQYTSLLANYDKAQLGEAADDAGSVRFEIVQPPDAPFGPVSPRRTMLLVGVLAAALGAGGALAYLLHMLKPVVGSARSLAELADLPVLGVVSAAFPRQLAALARGQLLRFVGAGSVLVAAFACVMVLNWLGVRLPGGAG
jgi:polysaccharide chain length determinant protein (PEP-CTERM system associated)